MTAAMPTLPADTASAKRLAIMAPMLAAGLAYIANVSDPAKFPIDRARVAVGMVILMVLLALMAEAAPRFAIGFGWLLIVTVVFVTGEPAWQQISKLTTPPK